MQITMGTSVWTKDNQQIGTVDKLIVNERGDAIRAIVVRRGGSLERDVEIPLDLLGEAADGTFHLPFAADRLVELSGFAEANYAEPATDAMLPAGYSATGLLVPSSGYVPLPAQPASNSQMAAPAGCGRTDDEVTPA